MHSSVCEEVGQITVSEVTLLGLPMLDLEKHSSVCEKVGGPLSGGYSSGYRCRIRTSSFNLKVIWGTNPNKFLPVNLFVGLAY